MKWAVLVLVALCLVAAAAWATLASQALDVKIATATIDTIETGYDEDGVVRSNVEAVIASKIAGRIQALPLQDGASVQAGQAVAVLESSELRAAYDAAQADVEHSRALLAETRDGTRAGVETASAELREAEAAWRNAVARRDEIKAGSRPQERERVLAARAESEAQRWQARRNAQREQRLFKKGYVPERDVDSATAAERQAEARYAQADAQVRLSQAGSREEQIRAAEAQAAQAAAALDAARARLDKARAEQAQVPAASAAVDAANAHAEQARAQLHDVTLTAPESGVLSLQDVSVGDVVAPGTPLARLVDPHRVWVEAQIDERDIAGVHDNMPVVVTCDAYPDATFAGTLVRLQGEAVVKKQRATSAGREEDRVFKARVQVQNPKGLLRPGMSVYTQIVTGRVRDVLTVPRDAIVTQGAAWNVWLVEGHRAHLQPVTVGARDYRHVEIKSGLGRGDRVVVSGRELLHEGARVRILP
jgi:HlyD family secretion protein